MKDGKKSESSRTDYTKNKPYTATPTYIKLGDYYTLPSGGRFVNRGGKPDTWYYRVLTRIPEHFCYNTPFRGIVRKLRNLGLNMNDSTLGDITHRIIKHLRNEMSQTWE